MQPKPHKECKVFQGRVLLVLFLPYLVLYGFEELGTLNSPSLRVYGIQVNLESGACYLSPLEDKKRRNQKCRYYRGNDTEVVKRETSRRVVLNSDRSCCLASVRRRL